MSYTPTHEDLLWAKRVFDDVIMHQVLNPAAVKEAYRRIFGHEAINLKHARLKVFSYFQYEYVPSSIPEDSQSIGTVENKDQQSHSEDQSPIFGKSDIQQDKLEVSQPNKLKRKRGPNKKK